MGMVVRTNTMALNAYRQLGMNNSAVSKSLEKLSSGFRINRAGDDAAGLVISEKMKAQIKGLETAAANAQDGISLIQTAEGNLAEVHDMLNRMVELATKSANGTYTSQERQALQDEVNSLLEEIDRISQSANFNGANLLDGSLSSAGKSVSGSDRILQDVLASGESPVDFTGLKTVLDSLVPTTEAKTKFTVDLTGLKGGDGGDGGKVAVKTEGPSKGADAKAATATLDFTGAAKTTLDGKKITIGGKTYAFKNTTAATGSDIEVDISAADTADAIAAKLAEVMKGDDGATPPVPNADATVDADSITATGATVTFNGKVTGTTAGAIGVITVDDGGTADITINAVTPGTNIGAVTDPVGTGKDGLARSAIEFGNGATKASFSLTVTTGAAMAAKGQLSIQIGDQIVTSDVIAAAGNPAAIATGFNGKTVEIGGHTFNITNNGDDIVFTAAENGDLSAVLAEDQIDLAHLTLQSAATSASRSVDFGSATGADVLGETLTIGDKTFEFVKAGEEPKKDGNIAVVISEGSTGAQMASKLVDVVKANLPTGIEATGVAVDNGTNTQVNFTLAEPGLAGTIDISGMSEDGPIAKLNSTEGKDGTAAAGGTATADFTGQTGKDLMNSTLKVGDTTYQFVADAADVSEGNTAVVITENDDAAALAANLLTAATATSPTGVTVAADAEDTGKVVFTATDATAELEASAGTGDGSDITFSFKLGGETLAKDIAIGADSDAEAIAEAIYNKLTGDGATTTINFKGSDYEVKNDGGKLSFELQSKPSKDNIQGNFDWDLTEISGLLEGNHTAGTIVETPGSLESGTEKANTVFRVETGDIRDGAVITIDGESVKLSVGKNSKVEAGAGVVDLKAFEEGSIKEADLNEILGKISEVFGGDTKNFIVGVNDKSNPDAHKGLTIHKKEDSKEIYDTKEKLAEVFNIKLGGAALKLQIGDTADQFNQMEVTVDDMSAAGLKLAGLSVNTQKDASDSLTRIKDAISSVSSARAKMGALQNRLEHTINNLDVAAENLSSANSRIRDTDMAKEMMNYTKMNVLVQSAQAMLAQANQQPQSVLQLLQ